MAVSTDENTGDIGIEKSDELTADITFDLLSNARRRLLLCYLTEYGETSVRELSRYTAAWENDIEPQTVSSTQRKRVYTALHQTHLPRLDEHGVIEYDRDRGTVVPASRIEVFDEYLHPPEESGPKWHRYYLGIGLATTVLAIGIMVKLPLLKTVQPGVAAFVVGTAVAAGAGVHAVHLARRVSPHFPDLRPSTNGDIEVEGPLLVDD